MPRIICMIQARMSSTRLPGKIMLTLLDKPMLWWDVYRVRQARLIDEIVIATTTETADDTTADYCQDNNWAYFRGSEQDVLDRYYQAAQQANANYIVRITSDCPIIDAHVLDYVIAAHLSAVPGVDYTSNVLARTYPRGLDTEVITFAALERAWREDTSGWREHVTPYIHQQPDKFRLQGVTNPSDMSNYRLTVDTPQDLELIRRIYSHFGHGDFTWGEVVELLAQHPDWLDLNRAVQQKAF